MVDNCSSYLQSYDEYPMMMVRVITRRFIARLTPNYVMFLELNKHNIKTWEKYHDTLGSLSIYQNAPRSSKFTKLPLSPKKYTL